MKRKVFLEILILIQIQHNLRLHIKLLAYDVISLNWQQHSGKVLCLYAKNSDHEHSKVLKSSHFQLIPLKMKISFWIHITHSLVLILLACTKNLTITIILFALVICWYLQHQNCSPRPILDQMSLIPGLKKPPYI